MKRVVDTDNGCLGALLSMVVFIIGFACLCILAGAIQ